eukprot:TRINITY_DN39533_c0_g1_i1.p1 TRINITY_DN39533_c0_g1~~TRINITY_DN39533_c0_g1_i1.p1  ORF type:complete len:464 (+),score=145.95 TRINITY_DN39533_c0_g1_i1:58-1449(+)
MDAEASFENRLRYVEQLAQQLTRQMKVMKQLVTSEVQDLKQSLQQQADDMRQVLIQQDRLYQEQVRRLETRVEQLAEFAMHLAQSKSLAATMGLRSGDTAGLPLSAQLGGSPRGARSPPAEVVATPPPAHPAGALGFHESDVDPGDDEGGIPAVLEKHRMKIDSVYRHYAETASRALRPTMALPQFTKFTKDCGLCNSSQGGTVAVNAYLPPPELLWMNVMRRLPQQRRRRNRGAHTASFAHERVQELSEEQFPDALVILAEEQYGKAPEGTDPAQVVERFLTADIFPVTDRRIEAAAHQREAERAKRVTPLAASSINDYYDNKEVQNAFKEYRHKLRSSFLAYVQRHHTVHRRSENLSLQGFCDLLRDHGLSPHISNKHIREIFLSVVHGHDAIAAARTSGAESPRGARREEDQEIDVKGFHAALRHVAEHVYGDRALVEKFPTPEARLRKLLAKMYLLAHG